MNEIKKDILNKIKKGEIKKTSPWYFVAKDYFFKAVFGLSIFLGSIGFSSALVQIFTDPAPHLKLNIDKDFIYYFLASAPYLWILFLLFFMLIAWFNYKNTEEGYKNNNISIVLISVIISVVLGAALFASGTGKRIDDKFKKVEIYKKYQNARLDQRRNVLEKIKKLPVEDRKEYLERLKASNQEAIDGLKD